MKAGEILKFVCDNLHLQDLPDGGFAVGGPDDEVKGILTTWLATPEAAKPFALSKL